MQNLASRSYATEAKDGRDQAGASLDFLRMERDRTQAFMVCLRWLKPSRREPRGDGMEMVEPMG